MTPAEAVSDAVAVEFGVDREILRAHGNRVGVAKQVAAEHMCVCSGASQRAVGGLLGYTGNGAVGQQRAKLRALLASDSALAARVERLAAQGAV